MKNVPIFRMFSLGRLFTWLIIGAVFVIVDLAILFFVLRSETPLQLGKSAVPPLAAEQQPAESGSSAPAQD